jgi:hypothetical protein
MHRINLYSRKSGIQEAVDAWKRLHRSDLGSLAISSGKHTHWSCLTMIWLMTNVAASRTGLASASPHIRTKQGQTVALALLSLEKPESMFGEPPL